MDNNDEMTNQDNLDVQESNNTDLDASTKSNNDGIFIILFILCAIIFVSFIYSVNRSKPTEDVVPSVSTNATEANLTVPETTSITTTISNEEKMAEDLKAKQKQIKEALVTFYDTAYSGASLISATNDAYIQVWSKMDYSSLKKVDEVFDNTLTLCEEKYGNNPKTTSEDLWEACKDAAETYEKAGLSKSAELALNCSNSYGALHNIVMEYSGTYKDYIEDYVIAYNNYVSDYNAYGDYLYSSKYIKEDKLKPLAKVEEYNYTKKVISEEVIYSGKDIVITINSINGLDRINFTIQNNGKTDLKLDGVAVAINGCMVKSNTDFSLSTALTASNRVVDYVDISAASYYGIKFIEDIDIKFIVRDENYRQLDMPVCHIDLVDKKSFEYEPVGDLVYDGKKISMYVESTGTELDDINAVYYNKSDKVIDAYVAETAINGVMLSWASDTILSVSNILPNCYYYTGLPDDFIVFWSAQKDEIEEKGLTNIERISGKVVAYDGASYRIIEESKALTIYSK